MEILNFTLFLKDLVEFKGKKKTKPFHKQNFNFKLVRGKKIFVPQQQFPFGPPQESEMKTVQMNEKIPVSFNRLWIRANSCSYWFQQYNI